MKFQLLENKKLKKDSEIKNLTTEHKDGLDFFGIKSETIFTLKNYCNLLAIYLNQENEAIEILRNTIENKSLEKYDVAICKMELAKILISNDDVWESSLLYSQVEKEFKEDIIGQQAKFEKIKINYYKGDFEWAQNQLKVLKMSTSKLISNNAIKLSLLISDNLNLDTTNVTLLSYAKAELLFEQKKYADCLNTLSELESNFPNHTLIDEVLLKKFDVFIKMKKYNEALSALNQICEEYYYDILYDDALFYQARIYEEIIKDPKKAKAKYEELMLKTPNSIFINKARKRYRLLRTNNLLKL
jgi:predicted negative regulator of RcsB-dependent stress response